MAETLYATFSDPNRAQAAADEMLSSGVGKDEISLFIKKDGHVKETSTGVDFMDTRPTTPMKGTEFHTGPDPLENNLRQSSVPRIERGVDADLNPAQNDYPRGETVTPTEFSSAPPSAERDYNRGLEQDDNKNYKDAVSEDMDRDAETDDRIRQKNMLGGGPYLDFSDSNEKEPFSRGYNAVSETPSPDIKVDPDADAYRDTDPHVKPDLSAGDVGHGAAHGAGIGLGVGAAAAVATMLIPGLGLVIGGGALAAAMAALITGTGVGALAGGLAGFFTQHGVPRDQAERFAQIHEKGGAILAVSMYKPELRGTIEQILTKHGANEVESHQAYMS